MGLQVFELLLDTQKRKSGTLKKKPNQKEVQVYHYMSQK